MGNRHNALNDDIFKNSKYIRFIERRYNIKDFRKEYREHYNLILDIYKTFILINNCFFSDSNLSNADKVERALKVMEELLFVDYEESEKHKYGVQDIRDIPDKRCRHIYNLIEEWHNKLESITSKDINNSITFENIKKDIEKEMDELEYAEFDSVELENISYQKNAIKGYRYYTKYLSKFDSIYIKSKEYKQEFKNKFYDNNGVKLDDNDLNKLGLLFKLLSSVNNGLINIITDYKVAEEITPNSSHDEIYKIYLNSCNIDYENKNFIDNSREFLDFIGIIKNKIDEELNYNNNVLIERFDLFFFYLTMEQCFYSHKIKVKSDYINKLLNDLIDIYKKFKDIKKIEKETSIEELKEQYFIPLYKKTNEMITKRYGDVYEKIS